MTDQDLPYLDESIQQLPQDIRQSLRAKAENDLYFFAKAVMGYRDMSLNCHGPLCQYLDRNPKRFKLLLMPRGHFKTSVATISRVAQKALRNPNERILLGNETSTNAERFLSAIKQHMGTNRVLRALFSDRIPRKPKRWSSTEIELIREWSGPEPTIDTIGMTGAMTSRHYTHITIDDPVSEEAVKSPTVMQDVISRIDKVISLMVKPEEDTFDLIGTRWAFYDVYQFFMEKYGSNMARFIRGAIEDGEPIFPELISLDTLAQARDNMGEYMFSCLYLNNPRNAEVQNFNVGDLRFWRWSSDEESIVLYQPDGSIREVQLVDLDITTSVDPAPAETIFNDPNAIVTTGVTSDGDVIVLDVWNKRCSPLEVIEHMFWLHKRYHPRVFGIEGVAYQKSLKYFVQAEAIRRGMYLNMMELKAYGAKGRPNTGAKGEKLHIRGLQPLAATGRLYILPTQHELRNQLADYPLGKHDDVIDALAMQQQMWRGVVSAEGMARYKKSEQDLIRRIRYARVRNAPREVVESTLIAARSGRRNPRDIPHPDDLGLDDFVTDRWQDSVLE